MKKTFVLKKNWHIGLLVLWVAWLVSSCQPNQEEPRHQPHPVQHTPYSQSGIFFITSLVGSNKDVGIIINDPISGLQFTGFGHKNKDGKMDSVRYIIQSIPATGGWLAHELNPDYTPKSTTTSTGQIIEYSEINFSEQTITVEVQDQASGRTVYAARNIRISDYLFGLLREVQQRGERKGNGFKPADAAELIYLMTSGVGCAMGVIGMSFTPLAMAWGMYNTYQNCKSALEAANNLTSGKPAFGCISTKDNANAISGFAETISQGGGFGKMATGLLPALFNYAAQYAGQGLCDDQPMPPPGGTGDPHLTTPDGLVYDFHGYGEFIALQSFADNFQVQVRQEGLYLTQATFNTALAIQAGSDVVCITANPQRLYIDNVALDLDFVELSLPGGAALKQVLAKEYRVVSILHPNGDGVQVRLNSWGHLDYILQLTANRQGKIQGLMGNYDGDPGNDLQLRNGSLIENSFAALYPGFADSWRITQHESLFHYEGGSSTQTYTRRDFPKSPVQISSEKRSWAEGICKDAGVSGEPFLSNCIIDVALTGDPAMASSALWALGKPNPFPPLDLSNVELQGEARQVDGCLRLTPAKSYVSGQAFRRTALAGDFETQFTFRIAPSANGSADGFAFLIAKSIPQLRSNAYPGKEGKLGYEGIKASLAVEFDTWSDYGENGNHVSIQTNGPGANSTHIQYSLATNAKIADLSDGMPHTVKITSKTNQLTVLLDGLPVLETKVNLTEKLGLAGNFFVGFTASTNGSFATHDICSWSVVEL